jgi:hypothetical protein
VIHSHIEIILYITGAATASMLLQFVAPRPALQAFGKLDVSDPVALFFARGAGLAIGILGILLIWAAVEPALRVPVMTMAAIGKSAFVATILVRFKDFTQGFLLTVIFDSACVLVYIAYLLGM